MSEPTPEHPGVDSDAVRRHLVGRVERWLDDLLVEEPPPEGLEPGVLEAARGGPGEPGPGRAGDHYALWSAVTTLTQEVKLQGRTFKQLQEALAPLAGVDRTLSGLADAQRELCDQVADMRVKVQRAVDNAEQARRSLGEQRGLLDVLMDLHTRLGRGLALCDQRIRSRPKPSRSTPWQRLLGRRDAPDTWRGALEALQEGYALTLQRLGDVLREHGVTSIGAPGQTFDPHAMQAVEVVADAGRPEGTVLEIYEPGFRHGDDVLRVAKVKVSGGPTAPPDPQEHGP